MAQYKVIECLDDPQLLEKTLDELVNAEYTIETILPFSRQLDSAIFVVGVRHNPPESPPITGERNRWLAEMAYLTYRRMRIAKGYEGRGDYPEALEGLEANAQDCWLAVAAAIRRRVVVWGLTAEE